MTGERTYIITYDISDKRRWRHIFRIMNDYGKWIQLSVFQCRLSNRRRVEMEGKLRDIINFGEDHVLIIDIGSADKAGVTVLSLGKPFATIKREAVVI